jgi:N-acetylglucosamine kinase-like BadF-type ATPase
MLTGSITATIVHGQSESPPGALDWSLGDFASSFAIYQALLFLTSLFLHNSVSALDTFGNRMKLT